MKPIYGFPGDHQQNVGVFNGPTDIDEYFFFTDKTDD